MSDVQIILLEDCGGDRFRMLSHLHQLWRRPEFRHCWLRGRPMAELEEDNGYCIPPGMGEIPFAIFMSDADVAELELENDEILIRAQLPSGRIVAVCDTAVGVGHCEMLRQEMLAFSPPRTHVRPDLRVWQPGVRLHLTDPLSQLSARALALPAFSQGLMAAIGESMQFSRYAQPLPAGTTGMFYGFNKALRSFICYDAFSDQVVCYGPVKEILKM